MATGSGVSHDHRHQRDAPRLLAIKQRGVGVGVFLCGRAKQMPWTGTRWFDHFLAFAPHPTRQESVAQTIAAKALLNGNWAC